jgi:enoyl-CoA hydratase
MANRVVPRAALDDEALALAKTIAQQDPFALALTKQIVNQTLDIQGQTAALQAGFNTHWMGHANALAATGYPILVRDVAGMKERAK